jgi:hypothetical protein
MAGKSRQFISGLLCLVALEIALASSTTAETVHGESQALGIKFEAAGGDHWCKPEVTVRLTGPASGFATDDVPFLQMVGRIRAVLVSQCPQIETIVFDGITGAQTRFSAEFSRLTHWRRFVRLQPDRQTPLCTSGSNDECAARVAAYLLARRLFQGKAFSETEVTNTLDNQSHDLSFRAGAVIGKLRIVRRTDVAGEYPSAARFAVAIAATIIEGCAADGGRTKQTGPRNYGSDLVQVAVSCRYPQRPAAQNVVLVSSGGGDYRVFSLWAEGPGMRESLDFSDRLATAMQRAR